MKIVIPISNADVSKLGRFALVLDRFKSLSKHNIMLVPTHGCEDAARKAALVLNSLAASVVVRAMDVDPPMGWPRACNAHFQAAARFVAASGSEEPWLWMELDALPITPGWADALEDDYQRLGQPFCGTVIQTPFRDATGKIVYQDGDTMMMGVGIYPAWLGIHGRCEMLAYCCAASSHASAQPWDVYLRHEIKNLGRAHTDLIADMWHTQNYRYENGQITADSIKHDRAVKERGGPINPKAVLVHGCKDDSLAKLLLGESAAAQTVSRALIQPTAFQSTEKAPPKPPKPSKEEVEAAVVEQAGASLKQGKAIRINHIGHAHGLPVGDVRDILVRHGFTVSKPGWVMAVPQPVAQLA